MLCQTCSAYNDDEREYCFRCQNKLLVLSGVSAFEEEDLEDYEEEVPFSTKLAKSVREFYGYIETNEQFIPNYGERYRHGEAIATGFVESTANQMVSKGLENN